MNYLANPRTRLPLWSIEFGSRARVHRMNFSDLCVRFIRGKILRETRATLPNVAKPRTKWTRRSGYEHAERGRKRGEGEGRKRRSETEVSSVVDWTCIRWIAASFENPRGRPPSCAFSYVGIRCPPAQCPAAPLHKLKNGRWRQGAKAFVSWPFYRFVMCIVESEFNETSDYAAPEDACVSAYILY